MEEEFYCTHQTDELLICTSDEHRDENSKCVVCSRCCLFTHNHGIMNFKSLTPFEKHCYRILPLLDKKVKIEESVRAKFKALKQSVVQELEKKKCLILTKLSRIISEDIAKVVKHVFLKNEAIDPLPKVIQEAVNQIKDVSQVAEQLHQYEKEIEEFRLDEKFIHKNNVGLFSPLESYQNCKSPQKRMVKTESQGENFRLSRTKFLQHKEEKQHNGTILIDLEDIANLVPGEIEVECFSAVSSILKENADSTNLSITIKGKESSGNQQVEDIRELCKKKFFSDLSQLKRLEHLGLNINQHERMTMQDVTNLENALVSLQGLKRVRISYHPIDQETVIYEYRRLNQKLGSDNVEIRAYQANN